eukprot:7243390-Prymnesium_polylepis.1
MIGYSRRMQGHHATALTVSCTVRSKLRGCRARVAQHICRMSRRVPRDSVQEPLAGTARHKRSRSRSCSVKRRVVGTWMVV